MGKSAPETAFNAVFRLRTRQARDAAGLTQAEVAAALGVSLDTYKKWENRETSAIPREYMYPFSIITRCDIARMLAPPTKQELAAVWQSERKTA